MEAKQSTMEGGEEEIGEFERLPEGCISHVLSLSSPIDACRSAATSRMFASVAESDDVWEAFLPHNYEEILSRASDSVASYPSKKELYFRLCESILIDGGRKSFRLEKSSGRICLIISARELTVVINDWEMSATEKLKPLALSRFNEVITHIPSSWFKITGKINTAKLSRSTTYAAYLVFGLARANYGYLRVPQEAIISTGSHSSHEFVSLFYRGRDRYIRIPGVSCTPRRLQLHGEHCTLECCNWGYPSNVKHIPRSRGDGWMELELGEFFTGEGLDGEVEITLQQSLDAESRLGLVVEGIELRPKN